MNVLDEIEKNRIVPVAVLKDIQEADLVLGTLLKAELPVAEITFRNEKAEEIFRYSIKKYPQMLIGAGTIISDEQCIKAIDAGAKFIVSPGLSKTIAEICKRREVVYVPGVVTPTEIMSAISLGLTNLKFFPASEFGGVKMIKTYCSVFPSLRFMPTGGISEENICEYLSFPPIFACGGSWMTKGTAQEIENKTRIAVAMVKKLGEKE